MARYLRNKKDGFVYDWSPPVDEIPVAPVAENEELNAEASKGLPE